jgi:hypothetical protein
MGENSRNGNLRTPTPLGLSLGAVELFQYQQLAYSGSFSFLEFSPTSFEERDNLSAKIDPP